MLLLLPVVEISLYQNQLDGVGASRVLPDRRTDCSMTHDPNDSNCSIHDSMIVRHVIELPGSRRKSPQNPSIDHEARRLLSPRCLGCCLLAGASLFVNIQDYFKKGSQVQGDWMISETRDLSEGSWKRVPCGERCLPLCGPETVLVEKAFAA